MTTFNEFIGVLLPSIILGLFIFLLFCYFRTRKRGVYQPRMTLLGNSALSLNKDDMLAPPQLSQSFLSWIADVYAIDDDVVVSSVGIDGLVFLRAHKIALKLLLFSCLYGFLILLPVYGTGEENEEDFLDGVSFANLSRGSPRMYAPLIALYLVSGMGMYLLHKEYTFLIGLTTEHKSKFRVENFTVMATQLPLKLQSEEPLRSHFEKEFPDQVLSVQIAENVETLDESVKKHNKMEAKFRIVEGEIDATGVRPSHKISLLGERVDSYEYYARELTHLQREINYQIKAAREPSPVAFVTFTSIEAANIIAAHSDIDFLDVSLNLSLSKQTSMACEPRDVMWEYLDVSLQVRNSRKFVSMGLLILLMFFWTIPVAFFSSITNLDNLGKVIPFLENFVNANPTAKAFLQGFLPTVALRLFMALLPLILYAFQLIRGAYSRSRFDDMIMTRYFACSVLMEFWVFTISDSLFGQISDFLNAQEFINTLARSLPTVANFFIGYVTLAAFVVLMLELLQWLPLIVSFFRRSSRFSSDDLYEIPYAYAYPRYLLMFTISITYTIISPIMLIFSVLYFAIGLLVWKHQLLYVYEGKYETGGKWWPLVFHRLMVGLFIMQLTTMGCMSVNGGYVLTILACPLLAATIYFTYRCNSKYNHFFQVMDPLHAKRADGVYFKEDFSSFVYEYIPETLKSGDFESEYSRKKSALIIESESDLALEKKIDPEL